MVINMAKILKVQVENDHLKRQTNVKKPILAISELIWNAFDGDAEEVRVKFQLNAAGKMHQLEVVDDGHGISYSDAEKSFGSLGGSWKKETRKSKGKGRLLHGQAGKGRYRSFSIGNQVAWQTRYRKNGKIYSFNITGNSNDLGTFVLGEKKESSSKACGTIVSIRNITKHFKSLRGDEATQEITEQFALYLSEYPDTRLIYDDHIIDPEENILSEKTIALTDIVDDTGEKYTGELVVIEWNSITERAIFLCDKNGFALEKINPRIQAPGFNFTAYIKSDYIRILDEKNLLSFDDGALPAQMSMLAEVRKILKSYFREKEAHRASDLVKSWKEQNIYPYEGEAQTVIEQSERQVFEICALNINEYVPNFEEYDKKSKLLSFQLLKEAIAENPKSLRKILSNVLELPQDKLNDLAELLDKTTLPGIINASKMVINRLDFLGGLEVILYEKDSKEKLLERSQLHKILESETWIFGEDYHLSVSDESLTRVLEKHLKILGKDRTELAPVLREDDKVGIVDLMLSCIIPQPQTERREHLIVELKRPSQKIGHKEASQIKDYAFAVAEDERFKDTNTMWNFFVISNEIAGPVQREANQKNRPPGLLLDDENLNVWVKTWGQVIEAARGRMRFYEKELHHSASISTGLDYLNKTHKKYLPDHLHQDEECVETV